MVYINSCYIYIYMLYGIYGIYIVFIYIVYIYICREDVYHWHSLARIACPLVTSLLRCGCTCTRRDSNEPKATPKQRQGPTPYLQKRLRTGACIEQLKNDGVTNVYKVYSQMHGEAYDNGQKRMEYTRPLT